MARSTVSGPWVSQAGMYNAGSGSVVTINANTTLNVADHAGRILNVTDADAIITLPTIDAGDVQESNNIGASFTIRVGVVATDMRVTTDGTDKYQGVHVGAQAAVSTATVKISFAPGATNDMYSLNGGTTGGVIVGTTVTFTAVAALIWQVDSFAFTNATPATPFSDS